MHAAARLIPAPGCTTAFTPTFRDTLHWLLVVERIDHRLALVTFNSVREHTWRPSMCALDCLSLDGPGEDTTELAVSVDP